MSPPSTPPPALLALLVVACSGDPSGDGPAPPQEQDTAGQEDTDGESQEIALVDAATWLNRASLDLRGVRPSPEELDAVLADEGAVLDLIDTFLADERFAGRMAWLWNDTLHTAVFAASYERFGELDYETWSSMGMAPLQLIETVIAEDRPFSEVLTRDETRGNAVLAELYPLDASSSGWQWTSWTDGRPTAGLLSSSTLWLRYTADAVNYNRTRANTVADLFLCADFLDREGAFAFDISAESLAEVERAVSTEPACIGCHASLDPLASFFGGFAERSDELDAASYVAYSEHQATWYATQRPPAYFGRPGEDLHDLADMMAADPRFHRCVAQRFAEGLVGETPEPADLDRLQEDFVASELDTRSLVRAIVTSDSYRAEGDRLLTNEQLHSSLVESLGWGEGSSPDEGLEALSWSLEHRVLAGGTDDDDVLERNRAAGIGVQVVLAWAARQAVPEAIEADLARTSTSRLLLPEDPEDTAEASVRAGLAHLHTRLLGEPVDPDSAEVDRLFELWDAAGGAEDPDEAWTIATMALVRHPHQVLY